MLKISTDYTFTDAYCFSQETEFVQINIDLLQENVSRFMQTVFMLEKGLPRNDILPRYDLSFYLLVTGRFLSVVRLCARFRCCLFNADLEVAATSGTVSSANWKNFGRMLF